MSTIRNVAVFGATGSIGRQALDVIGNHPDRIRASVLVAHSNVHALVALCTRHRPDLAIVADEQHASELERHLLAAGVRCDIATGFDAVEQAAASSLCDIAVLAMRGLPSIGVSLSAACARKRLVLANTESAVIAGSLLRNAATNSGGDIIPLSAPANAIARAMGNAVNVGSTDIEHLVLSRLDPLPGRQRADLMKVTPDDVGATHHDIRLRQRTVNAATMIDDGFEALAIHHLHRAEPRQLQIRLSAQRTAPVLVKRPGLPLCPLAFSADARSMIASALLGSASDGPAAADYREAVPALAAPDPYRFRCLALAMDALRAGGDAPALLNAANEVAVTAFLAGALPFLSIADVIDHVLTELPAQPVVDIQTLSARDRAARAAARRVLRSAC